VLEERRGDRARSHGERLPGELTRLAGDRGIALHDIAAFAVASGPGSFTGLRIGIATIQGLALATGRRIVAVPTLEVLAQTVADLEPGWLVAPWMDARRRDVFAALYRAADAPPFSPERLVEIAPPATGDPRAILTRWQPLAQGQRVVFVGDGAALYADLVAAAGDPTWRIVREPPLLAGTLGRIAAARAGRGETIDPAAVQPLYVRRPDAELAKERDPLRSS
jgi:tRNA threonylcarbamoyladenosine biosynthesis protein TsaB